MRDCVWIIFSEVVSVSAVALTETCTLLFSSSVSCCIICFKSSTAFACSSVPWEILPAFSNVSLEACCKSEHAFFIFWISTRFCLTSSFCRSKSSSFSLIFWRMPSTILLILSESWVNSGFPCSFTVISKFPSAIFFIDSQIRLIPRTIFLSTIKLIIHSKTPKIRSILIETTIVWLVRSL